MLSPPFVFLGNDDNAFRNMGVAEKQHGNRKNATIPRTGLHDRPVAASVLPRGFGSRIFSSRMALPRNPAGAFSLCDKEAQLRRARARGFEGYGHDRRGP